MASSQRCACQAENPQAKARRNGSSAGGPGAKPQAARRYVDTFLRQVGWQPQQTATFGGALQYSKYGALKRLVMILFVGLAGGDTDTSRDYEYTDWDAVDRFIHAFAQALDG